MISTECQLVAVLRSSWLSLHDQSIALPLLRLIIISSNLDVYWPLLIFVGQYTLYGTHFSLKFAIKVSLPELLTLQLLLNSWVISNFRNRIVTKVHLVE